MRPNLSRLPLIARTVLRLPVLGWLAATLAVLAAGASLWMIPALHVPLGPDAVRIERADVVVSDSETPPVGREDWSAVTLPHLWVQTHGSLEGVMWYRLQVPLQHIPRHTWSIYLPRVSMNAQVWVNDVCLGYAGSMDAEATRHWYTPLLFAVPPNLWKVGDNVVMVRVRSGHAAYAGLGQVWAGRSKLLYWDHNRRWWVQVIGVHAANVGLVMLGLFMIVLWLRDRAQSAFGFVGQAAVLWGMGASAMVMPEPLFDWNTWEHLSFAIFVWSQLSLCLFFLRFAERRWAPVEGVIGLMALAVPVVTAVWQTPVLVAPIYLMVYSMSALACAVAVRHAYRVKRPDRELFIFGCMTAILAATHDVAFQFNLLPFDSVYLLPYGGPVMMASLVFIVAGDYARSRRALDRLNRDLVETVRRREQELGESFRRLAALEQAQAVSAERTRILRDMHDGVGAHLTTALRQLNPPAGQRVDLSLVTRTLRDSLDQLKLSIDAMSMPAGDVVGLLASLRFRMTSRLKAAGLHLHWDVEDLPPWPGGHQQALRQLQYILFEAISNVLQHAGATEILLSAKVADGHIVITIADNGQGPASVGVPGQGQGSQTMRTRAHAIGASIEFLGEPAGGFAVRLRLPLPSLVAAAPLSMEVS